MPTVEEHQIGSGDDNSSIIGLYSPYEPMPHHWISFRGKAICQIVANREENEVQNCSRECCEGVAVEPRSAQNRDSRTEGKEDLKAERGFGIPHHRKTISPSGTELH
jgi:hypothetical protein